MSINSKQLIQIQLQLKAHQHKTYKTTLVLTEGKLIKNFTVYSKVMRPEIMTSIHVARWLFFNNGMYKGKDVLDMGCGSGILGIITALHGARRVLLSDISDDAVSNSKKNIKNYGLVDKVSVLRSNLFEKIQKKFDVVIFNHPFFGSVGDGYSDISMINSGQLLHRFLSNCRKSLRKDGFIVMPYFHLAGPKNNPQKQASKYKYTAQEMFFANINTGLQKGPVSIYKLSPIKDRIP